MKYIISKLFTLICLSIFIVSCQEKIQIEDPVTYNDTGDKIVLSDNVLLLDNNELTHSGGQPGAFYDNNSGELRMDVVTVEHAIDTGMVIPLNLGSGTILRRVVGKDVVDGEYVLQTVPGSIVHIFENAEFTLDFNTEHSQQVLKCGSLSNMTNSEISELLTDKNNHIHPSQVKLIVGDTEQLLFSKNGLLNSGNNKSTRDGKTGFHYKDNKSVTLFSLGDIKVVLDSLDFSLYSNFRKFFKFKSTAFPPSGDLKMGITAEDMDIDISFDMSVIGETSMSIDEKNVEITPPMQLQFEFLVGEVPVFVRAEISLLMDVEITLGGEVKISSGYTTKINVPRLHADAHASANTVFRMWHKPSVKTSTHFNYDYKPAKVVDSKFHPLVLEAMATLKQKYTMKPSIAFDLYFLAGPAIQLAPAFEYDFGVGSGVSISDKTHVEKYIGWGGELKGDLGASIGIWFDFLVLDKTLSSPTIPLIEDLSIWKTPKEMELVSSREDFGQTVVGQPKDVEVKVKDSWDFTTPFMFVEWISNEGGHWEHPITMATFHCVGAPTAKNRWIPEKVGTHEVSAYVKNGQLKEVDRINLTTTTVAPN